jgi:hypothetical protein
MNNLDVDLLLYGLILAALSVLAHRLSPDAGYATLVTGTTGGLMAVFLGVLGLRGFRHRLWAIRMLAVLDIMLLVQTISAWLGAIGGGEAPRKVALILTLLLGIGIVQLVNFVQAKDRKE